MSGRELDPDGTDSHHPEHPWEQAGHVLYLPPQQRTMLNWPPEPAYPAGPHEAKQWDRLPVRVAPEPSWRREYGGLSAKPNTVGLRCALGIHRWGYSGNAYTQAPATIRCERCGQEKRNR
ncbi:hypothetical protein [Microbacterium sp. CFBP 8794]|uniref:hypothetical protein n=1 Tax=Microbacterium sp. CFBP 8794 TaxID=2775269 RepID=UPI00178477F5|nr:hypothetical protein [Microbacterium sp. CFBP 8794]MBD8477581.1 hypothetical protein [Microbacterium sp. CFBP 8794]